MHEASLAGGILQLVEQSAKDESFVSVSALRLSVGSLSGVDVRALRFALEAIAPGTVLSDARINIDQPAGRAWCMACSESVVLDERGQPCSNCGSYQLQVIAGDELKVVDFQVMDRPIQRQNPHMESV